MAPPATPSFAARTTAELYRAVIGPHGQDYYLRQFQRFDADGRTSVSWNGPAFWATLNWMLYRRMWGWALAYVAALLGLAALVFGAGPLVFDYSNARAVLLFLSVLPLSFLVPGMYADAWYYRHCQRKIGAVQRRTDSTEEARQTLLRQAPGRRSLPWLVLVDVALLALAVLLVHGLLDAGGMSAPQVAADEQAASGGPSVPPLNSPAVPVSMPAASAPEVVASAAAPVASQTEPPASAAPASRHPQATGADTARSAASSVAAARSAHASPASPPRHVWVIQVGAYAQQAHAQQALAEVRALGLEAGAEAYATPQGRLIRVRVGPFARQDQAEQAARRIKALQLPVLVLRQRP